MRIDASGFYLIEVLIALFVLVCVMLGAGLMSLQAIQHTYQALQQTTRLQCQDV